MRISLCREGGELVKRVELKDLRDGGTIGQNVRAHLGCFSRRFPTTSRYNVNLSTDKPLCSGFVFHCILLY
jgi:hypothetical protein